MANTILPKRKSDAGSVPPAVNLQSGELAVNTADGRLYTKMHNGVVVNLPAQSLAGQTVPGSVQFGAIGTDSIKINNGGNDGLYRVITLQPNTLAASRTINLPDANCDLACTYNGNAIASGLTVNQKLNSLRNNLGDPSVEEAALFHGQFFNHLRFRSPAIQEESADGGTTWTASTRISAAALGDMMRGEGEGTNANVLPAGSATPIGYRLTWDITSTGSVYWIFNHLYINCSTNGNTVTFLVEAYHNTNGWTQIFSGPQGNWPGHVSIKHSGIAYFPTNAGLYSQLRVTFISTTATYSTPVTIYAIEWFGGYPAGKRNAESYDRDKNVTFPNRVRVTGTGTDSDCTFSRSGVGGVGLNLTDGSTLDLVTGSAKRMRISNSGVGIGTGTATPLAPLHIVGTTGGAGLSPITVASNSLNSAVTHISTPNNSTYPFLAATNGSLLGATFGWGFFDSSVNGSLEIKRRNGSTTWVDALTIERSNGTVAIGGNLLTYGNLGVGAACRSNLSCDLGSAAGLAWTEGAFVGMQFSNIDSYRLGLRLFAANRETRVQANTGDATGKITFYAGVGTTEHARVHSNGFFGIGTAAPTARLTVLGSGTGKLEVGTSAHGGDWTSLSLNGSGNTAGGYNLLASPTVNALYINRATGGMIGFRENNADQVTIASGGNVGIGTTTPAARLEVSGASTAAASQAAGIFKINGSATNALTFGTLTGGPFAGYIQSGGSGIYPLSLNPLGGNVGIGTTSPQSGFLLDVSGSSVIRGSVQVSGDINEFANSRFKLNGGTGSSAHSYASVGNGNFGINNSSPDAKLTVKGSGATALTKSLIVENSANTDILTVRDDGRVGIMQGSPAYPLDVTGDVRITGTLTAASIDGGGASSF